jgi:RsiW-degrading membrane proteinase PrsW (M82 family)
MKKHPLLFAFVLVAALVLVSSALAQDPPPDESDLALAQRYAPVFYFHPDEIFRPQTVDVIVEQARLRESRRLWFDANVLLSLDVRDLLGIESGENHFLDVWYGDSGGSAYTNYSAHRAYYEAILSPEAGGPPVAVYAHVVRDEVPDTITIQYWALYFYNDWFNKHEGDWEMVEIVLGADEEPEWVVLTQHHGGTRRAWVDAPVEDGTHPAAYVALGSHANYFVGDEIYPNGKDIGNVRIEIIDRTGTADRVIPDVILIPDRDQLASAPGAWPGAEWLPFQGRWGELALQSDFGGPLGPPDKGMQWETPYQWAMTQPLDARVWYANRLRVQVGDAMPGEARVTLSDAQGRALEDAELLDGLAILHYDLPAGEAVEALIAVAPGARRDVIAVWPDAAASQVTRVHFAGVTFGPSGRALLELAPDGEARLQVEGVGENGADLLLSPTEEVVSDVTWDAPDLVWIAGILPAHQVGIGLLIALVGSVVPTVGYVWLLYWMDRYEKEPKRLLAAAFVWGAIPAVAVAALVEVFFQLPPDLLGSQALEAIQLGLVAPVLEELLKGAAVLFIAHRYRHEFDNVLDGIIYGAMIGFGFAMTGNLISYVTSFAMWGYEAYHAFVFIEGGVRAASHALYTAVFGAALGYARLSEGRGRRWLITVGGFLLAVATHAGHNLLSDALVGFSPLTFLVTLVGVLLMGVVVVWSLARQRFVLSAELPDEVPEDLYRVVASLTRRSRAQWKVLWTEGVGAWWRARRLYELCAEVAFKKSQVRRFPEEPRLSDALDHLRERLVHMIQEVWLEE